MTHICVVNLTIIGSDNGLSPGRHQAIIWTNAGILLIGPLETNFIEILIRIQTFSFKKMHLKMSSAKWRPFYLGLNVLSFFWSSPLKCMYSWGSLLHNTLKQDIARSSNFKGRWSIIFNSQKTSHILPSPENWLCHIPYWNTVKPLT